MKQDRLVTEKNKNGILRGCDKGFIYCLVDKTNGIFRIGKTKNSDMRRQLSQISYYPFELSHFCVSVNYFHDVETIVHRKLSQFKVKSDWYKADYNLCYDFIKEAISEIRKERKLGIHKSQSENRMYDRNWIMTTRKRDGKKVWSYSPFRY